ncbi:MAG: single-stranded-DNA-specific exonuclease RecJ [candidate division TM6 bacterium GW2011_GWF2_38_10]|nr:MAG: single-stranded-DNA-specific exonuclease RecJ [candidate division TM6 bacterium GW2011_GWF2_38_10]
MELLSKSTLQQSVSHECTSCGDLPRTTVIYGKKYRWLLPVVDMAVVRKLAVAHSVSMPVAHALYQRGFEDTQAINDFLFCTYEKAVGDPAQLAGADAATDRILQAITRKEKILVFGDYDVDGITASAMLVASLIPLGANINYVIPSRQKDGYGLSVDAVCKAHKNNYTLIITVDNGITAHDAARKAFDLGMDLIITDHHLPHGQLPPAVAIINPNLPNCAYPNKDLAGVGVIFKVICLLYKKVGITTMPPKLYELLTLGTVADVVPLVGENRYWVRHGLCEITRNPSTAFTALALNVNMIKSSYNSLDIGFMIAPQINALGRMSNARDAVKFLISSDHNEVLRIGTVLKQMNEDRKKVEQEIFYEIEAAISNKTIDLDKEPIIVAAHHDWPAGVIGLVAGKLMQNYGRPVFLFHIDRDIAKGSCRSIPEFNIFNALSECQDLLVSFGGHACAAGLKVKLSAIPELKARLSALLLNVVAHENLVPKIAIDAQMQLPELTSKCWHDLEQLEPFGNQNPQPLFWLQHVTLLKSPVLLKDKHVKCFIFADGVIKPIIFFNRPDLFSFFMQVGDAPFHVAAYVVKNEWDGSVRIELQGVDVAVPLKG